MKLFDKLLNKFKKKRNEKPINRELFDMSRKDEYITAGTWETVSYYSMINDKKYELEDQNKMFDLKGNDVKTLKELCGIIEDTIAYSMSSLSPQINANVVIAEKKDRMLELINHIKEQIQ